MPSDPRPEPDPRRRNALIAAGVLGLAAIAWNADEWWDDSDRSVVVSFDGDEGEIGREISERVQERIRDRVNEEQADAVDEALAEAGFADDGEEEDAAGGEDDEAAVSEPRRTLVDRGNVRIERDGDDSLTISFGNDEE